MGGLSDELRVIKIDTRFMYSSISGNRTTTAAITVFALLSLKHTIPFNVSFHFSLYLFVPCFSFFSLSVRSLFLILLFICSFLVSHSSLYLFVPCFSFFSLSVRSLFLILLFICSFLVSHSFSPLFSFLRKLHAEALMCSVDQRLYFLDLVSRESTKRLANNPLRKPNSLWR
jgi:hypothetical protein